MRVAIANCYVFFLSSLLRRERSAYFETISVVRAIITADVPGCRETVVDGENGFLIVLQSVDELVAAMEKFIDQPELIERMGTRSREIAETKYDVHKVNAVMLRKMGLFE